MGSWWLSRGVVGDSIRNGRPSKRVFSGARVAAMRLCDSQRPVLRRHPLVFCPRREVRGAIWIRVVGSRSFDSSLGDVQKGEIVCLRREIPSHILPSSLVVILMMLRGCRCTCASVPCSFVRPLLVRDQMRILAGWAVSEACFLWHG